MRCRVVFLTLRRSPKAPSSGVDTSPKPPWTLNQSSLADPESVIFSKINFYSSFLLLRVCATLLLVLAKDAANQITPGQEIHQIQEEVRSITSHKPWLRLLRPWPESIDHPQLPAPSSCTFSLSFFISFVKLQTFKCTLPAKCPAKRLPGIIRYRG